MGGTFVVSAKVVTALDLNDIALFAQVVQASSFSKAARQRGVPVSTVSRRIARLESSLDARLLERTTRALHLTDVGRAYYAHAERALCELDQARQRVRELHASPSGRVRITAPIALGAPLTRTLATFFERTPLVAAEVELSDRRVDFLAEGFDIALRGGPIENGAYVARKLSSSTRGLFASTAYLERRGRPQRIDDLANHDLIATRASAAGAVWELFSADKRTAQTQPGGGRRFAFSPRLCVNELITAKCAALAGMGIALLPSPDVDKGELERVLPKVSGASGGLWLLYAAHRNLTAAVRHCIDHLLEHFPAAFVDHR